MPAIDPAEFPPGHAFPELMKWIEKMLVVSVTEGTDGPQDDEIAWVTSGSESDYHQHQKVKLDRLRRAWLQATTFPQRRRHSEVELLTVIMAAASGALGGPPETKVGRVIGAVFQAVLHDFVVLREIAEDRHTEFLAEEARADKLSDHIGELNAEIQNLHLALSLAAKAAGDTTKKEN